MKDQVKKLVSQNQTSDALSLLLELSKPNKQVHDAIHIVLAEFNSLSAQRLRGTIDNDESSRRLNIINDKILIALDSFNSDGSPLPNSVTATSSKSTKFLLRLGMFILGLGIVFIIIAYLFYIGKSNEYLTISLGLIGYYIIIVSLFVLGGWIISIFINAIKGK